jgi:hypothetical protein
VQRCHGFRFARGILASESRNRTGGGSLLIWKVTMKTRTIEDWRITQLFIELEKRVELHKLEVVDAAARNANPGFIKLVTGRWRESEDSLALVRSFLEESDDIKASIERAEK